MIWSIRVVLTFEAQPIKGPKEFKTVCQTIATEKIAGIKLYTGVRGKYLQYPARFIRQQCAGVIDLIFLLSFQDVIAIESFNCIAGDRYIVPDHLPLKKFIAYRNNQACRDVITSCR